MDAEEIAKLVGGIRLSSEAREKVVMITEEEAERGRSRVERSVVGKIFSRKPVNREALRSHLPRILHARGRTEIEMVGNNLFVISFTSESDRIVALEEGPWHFFQDLMILKQTEPMQTPMEVEFDEITLWVQCHNVPIECMDPAIIRRIGGRIGKVEEVDVGEGGMCVGKYARVRITRRIDEPLIRCVPLVHERIQKEVLVILQYEKLPEFCFVCGRIGHISRDCGDKVKDQRDFQFDSWLRAGRSFVGSRTGGTGQRGSSRGGQEEDSGFRSVSREEERRETPEARSLVRERERKRGEKGGRSNAEEEGYGLEEEGVMQEKGVDLMDVGVVEREEEREAEDEGCMVLAIEERRGGSSSGQVGVDERSPSKEKKKNSRKGGKGWKRLARESAGSRDTETTKNEMIRETGEGKKRRGGVGKGEMDEVGELGEPKRK